MNGLDLFSGIGGITLALRDWVTPIAYCEIDRYAQGVLLSRMSEGKLPMAPIWDDVTTLRAEHLPIKPDIIYGGFPCQDISVAGRGIGLEGKRSGLFFEIARLVGEIRPRFVFLENVSALVFRGLDDVVGTLSELRYDCRWCTTSAASIGAPYYRERLFLLAKCSDSINDSAKRKNERIEAATITSRDNGAILHSIRCKDAYSGWQQFTTGTWYDQHNESTICRVAYGIPLRSHRLKGLGNAVVPLQAKVAFERLLNMGQIPLDTRIEEL